MMYTVGEKVRVTIGPGRTCRGLVMCVGSSDDGKPTYDVLLPPDGTTTAPAASTTSNSDTHHEETHQEVTADAAATGRELTALPASDVSPLQPFELEDGTEDEHQGEEASQVAERLKDRGNTLFKLGDTDAAVEMFTRVLRTLEPKPVVGATVLVRRAPYDAASATRYRPGIISDSNDDGGDSPTYDVIYDEAENAADHHGAAAQEEEEDEEDGVAADRVLGVPASPCVWCAARLNLARCSFRRGGHAEVVEACTLVLVVARLTMAEKERPREERAKLRSHCLTALRMRGGSHLAQHHIGLARKDARSMLRSSGDDEDVRAQATRFEAEVERKAKALLKANRKLAKDVTRWVDASMAKHEEAALKGDVAMGEGDLPTPPTRRDGEGGSGGGGVEESKGGGRSAGDGADGGVKSWLGGWIR